ncbi:hypothetical protein ACSF6V_15865 [Escherichia coli]|uniref:hypothetical protein n=1 Tax=Escherichia coli TaxID=562 RepID=UPI003EE9C042
MIVTKKNHGILRTEVNITSPVHYDEAKIIECMVVEKQLLKCRNLGEPFASTTADCLGDDDFIQKKLLYPRTHEM